MRITRWGEYGIQCASYIASRENSSNPLVNAQEIADSQQIPVDYTRQILQRLKNGGVIKTLRGPQGGYLLSRPAPEINLADILRAAEGDTFEIICNTDPLGTEKCAPDSNCAMRPIWHKLHDHIESFLKGHTLQALLDSEEEMRRAADAPIKIGSHG
jgi:Rrf2 family protein